MKKTFKILGLIVAAYIVIGLVFAIKYSLTYDPNYTSYPNDLTIFLLNTFMWPLNF